MRSGMQTGNGDDDGAELCGSLTPLEHMHAACQVVAARRLSGSASQLITILSRCRLSKLY